MPAKSKSPSRRSRSKGVSPTPPVRRAPKAQQTPGARVYVRVRPKSAAERGSESLLPGSRDPRTLALVNGRSWRFDGVLYEDSTQVQVYQMCVDRALEGALTGKTTAVVCYGQSGAGKSYTMRGVLENPGIVPRVANALFTAISAMGSYTCAVNVSYIQVYLGKTKDLLSRSPEREVLSHLEGDTAVFRNLTSIPVHSDVMLLRVYDEGDGRKLIRSSPISAKSSRGHTVFIIDVTLAPAGSNASPVQTGRLMLVDLAGYEPEAAVARSSPLVVQETRTINASLLRLHRTIAAAGRREKQLPYQDCPLSMLLKDAFQPQNWSAIILALSPSMVCKPHTYTTLLFGLRLTHPEGAAERHGKQSWDSLKNRVVEQVTRAQAVLQWLKKQDPKEVRRFEATFGKVDSVDLSPQKVSQAIASLEATAPQAVPLSPWEDSQSVPAQLHRLWGSFLEQQRGEKQEFHREMEVLQLQQATEVASLQRRGAPEEELSRLRGEHAVEQQLKSAIEEEHQSAAWSQLMIEVQSHILRSAAQFGLLNSKVEAHLQGTTRLVDLLQLHELTFGGRPAPVPQRSGPPLVASSPPIFSMSNLAAQNHNDASNFQKAQQRSASQPAAVEDDPRFREQEEEDMRAYLGGGDGTFLNPAVDGPIPTDAASASQSVASSAGPLSDFSVPPAVAAMEATILDGNPLLVEMRSQPRTERVEARTQLKEVRTPTVASSAVTPIASSSATPVATPSRKITGTGLAASPPLHPAAAALPAGPTYTFQAAPTAAPSGYRIPSLFPEAVSVLSLYSMGGRAASPVPVPAFPPFRSMGQL